MRYTRLSRLGRSVYFAKRFGPAGGNGDIPPCGSVLSDYRKLAPYRARHGYQSGHCATTQGSDRDESGCAVAAFVLFNIDREIFAFPLAIVKVATSNHGSTQKVRQSFHPHDPLSP